MTSEWKQYVYGKFTETPEGAILPGKDYQCTGCSIGIPLQVKDAMRPTNVGPGVSDMTDWNEYLWNDEGGGFAIQPVLNNGTPWIVAGRIRGRSESGEKRHGRMYVQGHYISQAVEDFTPLSIKGISAVLKADPMQELDESLPFLSVNSADLPLEEGWLEKISVILVGVMSGVPIGIKSTKLPLEKFFTLFQTISCALPPCLSWRLSMHIGAMQIKEGTVVLAQGSSVMGGPRLLGYKWEAPPEKIDKIKGINAAKQHPRKRGVIGERYLKFLTESAKDVTTLQELQNVVREKFPSYCAWDAQPFDVPFQDLAVQIVEDLIERDALRELQQGLETGSELPMAKWFRFYQSEALQFWFPYALTSGATFFVEILEDLSRWKRAWETLSNDEYAGIYSAVFTADTHLKKEQMSAFLSLNIPEELQSYVRLSLHSQLIADLSNEQMSDMWAMFFSSGKQPWLETWFQSVRFQMFWVSLRHRKKGQSALYDVGQNTIPWTYVDRLQKGESLTKEEGEIWLEAMPTDVNKLNDLSALIETVMERNIVSGIEMMGWSDVELPLKKIIMSDKLYEWELGSVAVQDIVTRLVQGMELQEITARIAFAFIDHVNEEQKKVLYSEVNLDLSLYLGFPLLGLRTGKSGKWDTLAKEVFLQRYQNDANFGSTVISDSFIALTGEDKEQFRTFILSTLSDKENRAQCIYGEVLQALVHEWNAPKITEDMVETLSWLLTGIKLNKPTRFLHDAAALRALIIAGNRKLELTAELLNCLLTAEQSSFQSWQKIITEQGWDKKDGWQILSRLGQNPEYVITPTVEESQAIIKQQPERLLEFVHAGILVTSAGYQRIVSAYPIPVVLDMWKNNGVDTSIWSKRNIYIGLVVALHSAEVDFIQYQATLALKALNDSAIEDKITAEYGRSQSFFGSVWSKVGQNVGQLSRMVSSSIDEGEDLEAMLNKVFSSMEEEKRIAFFEKYQKFSS
jgi:hypothetical protein